MSQIVKPSVCRRVSARREPPSLSLHAFALLSVCAVNCAPALDGAEPLVSKTSTLEADEIPIGPAGKSMNYFRCADENGTCNIGGARYMAFGASGNFVFALKAGNVPCNVATFGANPVVNKACYFSNYGNFPNTTPLATENQRVTANGSVAFGANGAFQFKTIRGSFRCDTATFGDPVAGVAKACYLAVPPFTLAAREAETLSGLDHTPIAYGSNGKFNFRIVAGASATCDAATFGDPASGATNDCYRLVDGRRGTVPVVYLADENASWQTMVQGSTLKFYGSGRNGNFLSSDVSGNSGTCTNDLGDPDYGIIKHCWAAPFPVNQGAWSRITTTFPCANPADPNSCRGPIQLQLLMDGSVLASAAERGEAWYRFSPDPVNGYAGGSWTGPYLSHYSRWAYATAMLRDGRYVVAGGEFATEKPSNVASVGNHSEAFDTQALAWADLPDYPVGNIDGGVIAPLPDGRLVVGAAPGGSMIFDPGVCPRGAACTGSPWSDAESITGPDGFAFGEGSITHLQNGNLLAAENRAGKFVLSAPQGSRWSTISSWPSPPPAVWDESIFIGLEHGEAGPLLGLYSGQVFIAAATGYNALYDPASDTISGTAATPGLAGAFENTEVVMPNANVLLATTHDFLAYKFYEFNTTSNTFYDISLNAPDFSSRNGNVVQTPLPDGTIMLASSAFKELYIYHPVGSAPTQFSRPSITSISAPDASGVYTLSGTTLNGLTNGANRDDEGHPYTSFPIVTLSRGGSTWYADVRSVSTMSIHPGDPGVVKFAIPAAVPRRTLTVQVSASGFRSSNSRTISF